MIFDGLSHSKIRKLNRKFKDLEYSTLLDQLAQHTEIFTKLLNENGSSQQKEECQNIIRRILAEINIRERLNEREPGARKDSDNRINR
jgi:hypothetical protein